MNQLRAASICLALILGWQGLPARAQTPENSGQTTISDPAEFRTYQTAASENDPSTKASELEYFLLDYPNSAVKKEVLEQLLDAYQVTNEPSKAGDAAGRLLQLDPNNMKALFVSAFLKKEQCSKSIDVTGTAATDAQSCDDAAALAQRGLAVPKPADMPDDDWRKVTDETYPAFHSAIAQDYEVSRRDLKSAIAEYSAELSFNSQVDADMPSPGLADTVRLAQVYLKPGDTQDQVKAIWLFARAWDSSPPAFKTQIEQHLDYWYEHYHGALDGLDELRTAAKMSLFPPSGFQLSASGNVPHRDGELSQPSTRAAGSAGASSGSSSGSSCPFCVVSSQVPSSVPQPVSGMQNARSPYLPGATSLPLTVPREEKPYLTGAYSSVTASGGRRAPASLSIASNASALPANAHPVYAIPEGSVAGVATHVNGRAVPGRFGRLDQHGAATVIQLVNRARSSMKGINRIPLPAGNVFANPDGDLIITPSPGHSVRVRPDGTISSVRSLLVRGTALTGGSQQSVSFDRKGRITEVHNSSLDIYHGPHGIRTVASQRPDGKVLVSTGARSGYLEDTFTAGSVSYLRRSYLEGSSRSVRIYRLYDNRGQRYYRYVPARSYPIEFYKWTHSPWHPPVVFKWFPNPAKLPKVYGHYYPAPFVNFNVSDWITDYIFIEIFNDASNIEGEDSGSDANAAGSQDSGGDTVYANADTPVTPELRQAIADEVQEQLQEQLNSEAAAADSPDQQPQVQDFAQEWSQNRYFVASNPMEAATEDGHTCLLDAGNVLRLESAPAWPPANAAALTSPPLPGAELTVVGSLRSDCPADATVSLPLDQLEEMENGFLARLDDGLRTLYSQQGQSGLPTIPDSVTAVPQALYAAPTDDNNLKAQLTELQNAAAQAEADARNFAVAELASAGQQ